MNNIQTQFSIKDLENLSGIKAHTIRIWEKRYDLLSPERSETNIRNYNIASFQKLLNIAFLNKNGVKISKIASLKEEEIPERVREIASTSKEYDHHINALKMAMINFDVVALNNVCNSLNETHTFTEVFYKVLIPLLEDIGILWQTNSLTPAHERFISIHIKQKIILYTDNIKRFQPKPDDVTYVLFLPDNEIHDIGLLFLNYKIRCKGHHTVYLGESLNMESLISLQNVFKKIHFVSYFTVKPETENIAPYIEKFNDLILKKDKSRLTLFGRKTTDLKEVKAPNNVSIYKSIEDFVNTL